MPVVPVALLCDNYAYLAWREGDRRAVVVDPSEAEPVLAAAAAHGVELAAVWLTHHHEDHVGGVRALVAARPRLAVVGSRHDHDRGRLPCSTHGAADRERLAVGPLEADVLAVPGHTLGAVAYRAGDALFTGDTLFLGGVGRIFEGTHELLASSLERLASLPDETRIYCGHEYTVRNLEFASREDPGDDAVREALERARAARARGEPTVPGRLGDERRVNPFLRALAGEEVGGAAPLERFTRLRRAKDRF